MLAEVGKPGRLDAAADDADLTGVTEIKTLSWSTFTLGSDNITSSFPRIREAFDEIYLQEMADSGADIAAQERAKKLTESEIAETAKRVADDVGKRLTKNAQEKKRRAE